MDEREQLETQWGSLSVAQRQNLFRAWVLAETIGFQPASFAFGGGSEVEYAIAPDASSWQVAVPASLFSQATPAAALGAGETIIEIGHLFAELRETIDELSEFEFEDESLEGQAAAILPGIIDALEQERQDLENALGDAGLDPETLEALENDLEAIEEALEELLEELEELGISV
ncbi:MAG: hypothetical protein GEU90_06090 [Gemmatimonas sp.]|nr:hypothetical protein [Gemmatimonas sp.]